uniref:ShKT domain-containing protein n=1 Tax=Plectus sambesii TaxID=2011161 RepID=A0A914UHF3_9BILA
MRRECQESCRVCQNDQECTNYNSLCGVWAWMGRCTGGAGSSARQVLTTCPLACGVCLPRSADDVLLSSDNSCQDRLLTCRRLARKGRCFYKHVLRLCPAACNSCNRRGTNGFDLRAPSTRAPSANSCRDTWSTLRCARWKNHGWCSRRNDSAMRHYCKLTCGFCSLRKGDSHSCEDINPLCQIIARHDMCGPMMKLQCARTCHVC